MGIVISIIACIAGIVLGIVLIRKGIDFEKWWLSILGFFLIIFSPLFGMITDFCISNSIDDKQSTPQAIDVYRGKTTLEITYRDSVPVDSVVVFKPEFKK